MEGITSNASLRLAFEENEAATLSKYACLSKNSRGREFPEKDCFIRTCFQRDVDRIVHCESFRRLKHKTQVFLSPTNDHFRTRLTHTLEVVCTARCISRCLGLNEDLTEAIALGHDLGHTPFGHSGEAVLNEISETGFHHASHSVRVVTRLEKDGQGLNLTKEVIDGILKHSKGRDGSATFSEDTKPLTVEAQVVRIADLVAYLNHDIDDAIGAGVITQEELPAEPLKLLGNRHSVRIHTMVRDIISNSYGSNLIKMSSEIGEATEELKRFLYKDVYTRPEINIAVQKAKNLLREIAEWYNKHPNELLNNIKHKLPDDQSFNRTLIDYLAGMTDDFALRRFQEIFLPQYYSINGVSNRKTEFQK